MDKMCMIGGELLRLPHEGAGVLRVYYAAQPQWFEEGEVILAPENILEL